MLYAVCGICTSYTMALRGIWDLSPRVQRVVINPRYHVRSWYDEFILCCYGFCCVLPSHWLPIAL